MDPNFVNVIRAKIKQNADALWQNFMPDFRPLFPWIFLYVLPKEQKIGHIWLPSVQNKITYEGIVLKTWGEPFLYKGHTYETQLKEGDHVGFPHFAGQPVTKELDKEFRLVKEYPISWGKEGDYVDDIIFCKLDYTQDEVKKQLSEFLLNQKMNGNPKEKRVGWTSEVMDLRAEEIMEKFIVVPKTSKTISGA